MGKLPYIKDKPLYAAVMGACSYVRETGYFNKATSYYANKYNVDVEDVRKYVRIAQGNGQRGSTRKYKWYVIIALPDYMHIDDCGTCDSWEWSASEKANRSIVFVKKATSLKNAELALSRSFETTDFLYRGGKFLSFPFAREFLSEEEANRFEKTINKEFAEEIYNKD